MLNHGGITPPKYPPDYCAQKQNRRSENKRSLPNQTDLTEDVLNELLKHQAMLPDRAESIGVADYLSRAECPLWGQKPTYALRADGGAELSVLSSQALFSGGLSSDFSWELAGATP